MKTKTPWRYPQEAPLTRNEVSLSAEHQARLDELILEHPTINTRVQMFRALLDSAPIEQVRTIRIEKSQISQIVKIGNLLNQYAGLAHTYVRTGEPIAAQVLHEKVDEANALLSQILKSVRDNAA